MAKQVTRMRQIVALAKTGGRWFPFMFLPMRDVERN